MAWDLVERQTDIRRYMAIQWQRALISMCGSPWVDRRIACVVVVQLAQVHQLAFDLSSTWNAEERHEVRPMLHGDAHLSRHRRAVEENVVPDEVRVLLDVRHLPLRSTFVTLDLVPGRRAEDILIRFAHDELHETQVCAFPGIEPFAISLLLKLFDLFDPLWIVLEILISRANMFHHVLLVLLHVLLDINLSLYT